jgi:hypothetical protein
VIAQTKLHCHSGLVVKDRDRLKTRMKITAYNQHAVGSFSPALVCFVTTNLLAAMSPRGYAVKLSEGSKSLPAPPSVALPANTQIPRCARDDRSHGMHQL